MNKRITFVDISEIRAGDTVLHNGKEKTVSNTDIKRDDFMGITLFGDSYHFGYKQVPRIEIQRALP